jgi:hypothetical protein
MTTWADDYADQVPEPRSTGDHGYYESWTEKADPQSIPPDTWTRLRWAEGTDMPVPDGPVLLTLQVYPELLDAQSDGSYLKIRLARLLPDGTEDYTAYGTYTVPAWLKSWALPPHTTFMVCSADTPIAVDVYQNGWDDLVMGNRIYKVWQPGGGTPGDPVAQYDRDAVALLGPRPA